MSAQLILEFHGIARYRLRRPSVLCMVEKINGRCKRLTLENAYQPGISPGWP